MENLGNTVLEISHEQAKTVKKSQILTILGQFWPLSVGRISPKMPKGTSTGLEPSNKTLIDSLDLTVLEILPGQTHKDQIFDFWLFLAILALPVDRNWPSGVGNPVLLAY